MYLIVAAAVYSSDKMIKERTLLMRELALKVEGARLDRVRFNVKDDIADDIRISRKELFEAIFEVPVIKQTTVVQYV